MKIIKEIGRNPNIDWITILFLSGVITIVLAFLDYSLYNAVMRGSIRGGVESEAPSTTKLNEKVIGTVINNFDKKAEESKKVMTGYVGSTDPSK